jgi:hypothetical protein
LPARRESNWLRLMLLAANEVGMLGPIPKQTSRKPNVDSKERISHSSAAKQLMLKREPHVIHGVIIFPMALVSYRVSRLHKRFQKLLELARDLLDF